MVENPFLKTINRVHLVQARAKVDKENPSDGKAQITVSFNVKNPRTNERATQYTVFERLFRDKQSFLEWRMTHFFTEQDLKSPDFD